MIDTITTGIMCHRYKAITLALARDSTRRTASARSTLLSAGAKLIASPACAHPNASMASEGGSVFCTAWPGTPIMLTG